MVIGAPANYIRAILLWALLLAAGATTVWAQNASRPTESLQMRRLHRALSLADHGDKPGAMNLVLSLLAQHPDFAPALKLKGALLEEAGRPAEAAARPEEAAAGAAAAIT